MEKLDDRLLARIIQSAVVLLPASHRATMREEWLSHLHEVEGPFAKLSHVAGCVSCVFKTLTRLGGLPAPAPIRIDFNGHESFATNEIAGLRIISFWVFGLTRNDPRFRALAPAAVKFLEHTHDRIDHQETERYGRHLDRLPSTAGPVQLIYFDGKPVPMDQLSEELERRFRKYVS